MQNPMLRYEWRIARETRRLAQIDLKKTEILAANGDSDVLLARTISRRLLLGVVGIVLSIVFMNCIDGMVKNYHTMKALTACYQTMVAHELHGRCRVDSAGHVNMEAK